MNKALIREALELHLSNTISMADYTYAISQAYSTSYPSYNIAVVEKARQALAALDAPVNVPEGQEMVAPYSNHRDEDGCPTETSVLKRYWRRREREGANPTVSNSDVQPKYLIRSAIGEIRGGDYDKAVLILQQLEYNTNLYTHPPVKVPEEVWSTDAPIELNAEEASAWMDGFNACRETTLSGNKGSEL